MNKCINTCTGACMNGCSAGPARPPARPPDRRPSWPAGQPAFGSPARASAGPGWRVPPCITNGMARIMHFVGIVRRGRCEEKRRRPRKVRELE